MQAIVLILTGLTLLTACPVSAEPERSVKVIWFANLHENPHPENNPFWELTKYFIVAAAEDLGVELTVFYSKVNHLRLLKEAEILLKTPATRPDAILFHNYKYTGRKLLDLAEACGVKAFVFNAGFSADETVGKPRTRYSQWIGELYPDDEYAGNLLAEHLVNEADKIERKNRSELLHAFCFAGSTYSQASLLRTAGNRKYQKQDKRYKIINTIFADWSKDKAFNTTCLALNRFPEISIFWAASDLMAMGAIEGAITKGRIPGKDFVAGGVDCLPIAQEMVKNGRMAVSVGGHYTDGAWALILIHDYFQGIDFADTIGVTLHSKMFALTASNHETFGDLTIRLSQQAVKKIDFSLFSKACNTSLKAYPLDALSFLRHP